MDSMSVDLGSTAQQMAKKADEIEAHAAKYPSAKAYHDLPVAALLRKIADLTERVQALEGVPSVANQNDVEPQ